MSEDKPSIEQLKFEKECGRLVKRLKYKSNDLRTFESAFTRVDNAWKQYEDYRRGKISPSHKKENNVKSETNSTN